MATATALSLNVEDRTGERAYIPPYDVARLMFYLKCMNSLGPQPKDSSRPSAPSNLTDFDDWERLNFQDIRTLVAWCRFFAMDNAFAEDFTVCDAGGEVDSREGKCTFIEVSADVDVVSVGLNAIVASSAHGIGKKLIMLYTPKWLKTFFTDPLANVSIYHCMHCEGVEGPCACRVEKCDRPGVSRCYIPRPYEHAVVCNGCEDGVYVTGALYMCAVCVDYALCRRCYEDRNIHNFPHWFKEFAEPGAQPALVDRRKTPGSRFVTRPAAKIHHDCPGCQCGTGSSTKVPAAQGVVYTVPAAPSTPTVHPAKAPFTKGDVVTLKGLAWEDMDGKGATVLSVDVANKKAQVQVDGRDQTFRVKWENIELVKDLEDSEEELE